MGARSRNQPGPLSVAVAAILSQVQDDSGTTQKSTAEAAGISQSQFSKYLRATRTPTIDELYDICNALDVDIVDVVRRAKSSIAH